ncbi:MAG: hypothetical protein WKF31_07210 [Thermoleophilaceae bacterium]
MEPDRSLAHRRGRGRRRLPPRGPRGRSPDRRPPLILLGSVLSFASYREWKHNEHALRLDQPLPYRTRLSRLLGWGVAVIAVVTAVLAVADVLLSGASPSPPAAPVRAPR